MSGVGKGTTISAIGKLLLNQNYVITAIKIDPYLNYDAGTMSPTEHGEVFVLNDGGEVDLDLGNYERALNAQFTKDHNITSGKVFQSIFDDERKGNFLGKTIQIVPHVTDRIKQMIENTATNYRDKKNRKPHICLVEIGGTVGDLESGIFYEAIRQFIYEKGSQNCAIIMLAYVPIIGDKNTSFEAKTKLTQHGIKDLKSLGLFPNFIICRSECELSSETIQKIAKCANLPKHHVGNSYNVDSICDIPLILHKQEFEKNILNYFSFGYPDIGVEPFEILSSCYKKNKHKDTKVVKIVMCGKYCSNNDTYYSVLKAIQHSTNLANKKLDLKLLDVSPLDKNEQNDETKGIIEMILSADGILVPGGFGSRGVEGMIKVCEIARTKKIPYLGICLGMQVAVIEFCRNVLGIKDAHSSEFVKELQLNTHTDVITTMEDTDYNKLGGTLRLGNKKAYIKDEKSLSYKIYGCGEIYERHRHRFEVNNKYIEVIEKAGMKFSGRNEEGDRMDMMEIDQDLHPFFYGLQSHPEFLTRDFYPSLPFYAFILHSAKEAYVFEEYVSQKSLYKGKRSQYDESYFMKLLTDIAYS